MQHLIYTYYEEVPEMEGQLELLELWAYSWQRFGWTPVVLGDQHARCHPSFEQRISEWAALPSANYQHYDMACYKRWLALGAVGGGILVDYDVCNNGFPVDYKLEHEEADVVLLANMLVPCAVRATPLGCIRIASWFRPTPEIYSNVYGKPHVSDMIFFQCHIQEIKQEAICFGLCEAGADGAAMVHFSHHDVCDGKFRDGYQPSSKADAFRRLISMNSPVEAGHGALNMSSGSK